MVLLECGPVTKQHFALAGLTTAGGACVVAVMPFFALPRWAVYGGFLVLFAGVMQLIAYSIMYSMYGWRPPLQSGYPPGGPMQMGGGMQMGPAGGMYPPPQGYGGPQGYPYGCPQPGMPVGAPVMVQQMPAYGMAGAQAVPMGAVVQPMYGQQMQPMYGQQVMMAPVQGTAVSPGYRPGQPVYQ
eukprot:gnl/TRDRNA2_/TRDRNA2_132830_c0_seq2.p3 gnl/TRDRNA2_/TRDRNA2_132830_c0~~gnl/TRDRNA2_/TRDRNA2_132830_c0_seq2.p3  ORF type:complete len:184 (-),score=25.61 gnl/TRDRNA2_/TRDRNA2_132830_c0_seq2:75-626(-)